MDAVLLLNDVPAAKLKHEIVDKNSRLGRVFNLSSLLRGHKIARLEHETMLQYPDNM